MNNGVVHVLRALSVRKIGSGAIGEEDVVGWIEGQREGVVGDGGGEIQGFERRIG